MAFRNPITSIPADNITGQITGSQIADGAVGTVQLADDAITGQTITGGTMTGTVALYYSGTPAAGNLIASLAQSAGTDEYGNAFMGGLAVYDPAFDFAQLSEGALNLGTLSGAGVPDTTDQATVQLGTLDPGLPYLVLRSPAGTPTFTDQLVAQLLPATPGQAAAGGPSLNLLDNDHSSAAGLNLSGAIVKTTLSGVPYTWQTSPAYGTGWAAGPSSGTVTDLQYRLDGQDNLIIQGACHATSATPGATVFTLPTGYRPKVTGRRSAIGNHTNTAVPYFLDINSTGVVTVYPTPTETGDLYIEATIPMGNIT